MTTRHPHRPHRRPDYMACLIAFAHIATTALLVLLMALAASGCRTVRYVTTTRATHTTDTVLQWRTRVDSVLVADSVATARWQSGDTVYIEKNALRIRNRVIVQHDTLWRTRLTADTAHITQLPPATATTKPSSNNAKLVFSIVALAALGLLFFKYERG